MGRTGEYGCRTPIFLDDIDKVIAIRSALKVFQNEVYHPERNATTLSMSSKNIGVLQRYSPVLSMIQHPRVRGYPVFAVAGNIFFVNSVR